MRLLVAALALALLPAAHAANVDTVTFQSLTAATLHKEWDLTGDDAFNQRAGADRDHDGAINATEAQAFVVVTRQRLGDSIATSESQSVTLDGRNATVAVLSKLTIDGLVGAADSRDTLRMGFDVAASFGPDAGDRHILVVKPSSDLPFDTTVTLPSGTAATATVNLPTGGTASGTTVHFAATASMPEVTIQFATTGSSAGSPSVAFVVAGLAVLALAAWRRH